MQIISYMKENDTLLEKSELQENLYLYFIQNLVRPKNIIEITIYYNLVTVWHIVFKK